MKIIIFGAGAMGTEYCQKNVANAQVIAFADNNPEKWDKKIMGYPIINPQLILVLDYDKIVIAINDLIITADILIQLLDMNVPLTKIEAPLLKTLSSFKHDDSERKMQEKLVDRLDQIFEYRKEMLHIRREIADFQIDVLENIFKNGKNFGNISYREAQERAALLLNDTFEDFHHGSCGTSFVLQKWLESTFSGYDSMRIQEIREIVHVPQDFEDFIDDAFYEEWVEVNPKIAQAITGKDVVVVNGEGCLSYYPWSYSLLYIIYIAKIKFHKYVAVINTSLYESNPINGDDNITFRKMLALTLNSIDYLSVREYKSIMNVSDVTFRKPILAFDCLPIYITQYYKRSVPIKNNYIIISGGNFLPNDYEEFIREVIIRLPEKLAGCKIFFLVSDVECASETTGDTEHFNKLTGLIGDRVKLYPAKSADEWLSVIENAKLLISGRFHHTIAAFMLNTPFITFQTDTQKVEAVLDMMGMQERLLRESDVEYAVSLLNKRRFYALHDEKTKQNLINLAKNNFSFVE